MSYCVYRVRLRAGRVINNTLVACFKGKRDAKRAAANARASAKLHGKRGMGFRVVKRKGVR